jgi:hypothetical protein
MSSMLTTTSENAYFQRSIFRIPTCLLYLQICIINTYSHARCQEYTASDAVRRNAHKAGQRVVDRVL